MVTPNLANLENWYFDFITYQCRCFKQCFLKYCKHIKPPLLSTSLIMLPWWPSWIICYKGCFNNASCEISSTSWMVHYHPMQNYTLPCYYYERQQWEYSLNNLYRQTATRPKWCLSQQEPNIPENEIANPSLEKLQNAFVPIPSPKNKVKS